MASTGGSQHPPPPVKRDGSDSALIATQLAIRVFRDQIVESGHVDLPPCLDVSGSSSHELLPSGSSSSLESLMVEVCRTVRHANGKVFQGMMDTLKPTRNTCYSKFVGVANVLFKEGEGVKHSKIISFYVFCAELVDYCMRQSSELGAAFVPIILTWHSQWFHADMEEWMADNGGWAALESFLGRMKPPAQPDLPDGHPEEKADAPVDVQDKKGSTTWLTMTVISLAALGISYSCSASG